MIVIRKFKELTGQEYSIMDPLVAIKLIRNWSILPLIGARGFEPPTSASRTLRATRLRYAPFV